MAIPHLPLLALWMRLSASFWAMKRASSKASEGDVRLYAVAVAPLPADADEGVVELFGGGESPDPPVDSLSCPLERLARSAAAIPSWATRSTTKQLSDHHA